MLTEHMTVPADRTYDALRELRSKHRYGTRSIAHLAEVGRTTIARILNGKKVRVEPETEEAVLDLLSTVKNWRRFTENHTCSICGLSHHKPNRLNRIRMMLPTTFAEIADAYQCVYPDARRKGTAGARMLNRDLHDLGAESVGGVWAVHTKPYPSSPETDTT